MTSRIDARAASKLSRQTAAHFSDFASQYHADYARQTPAGYALRVRHQRVLELLEPAGQKVLDIGCGPGVLVQALAKKGHRVWGIDAAEGMIAEASRLTEGLENVTLSTGDAAALTFADGSFDAATCIGVIERIVPNAAAFSQMARILRSDGVLVISFPNALSPYVSWKKFVFYPLVSLLKRLMGRPPLVAGPLRNVYTPGRVRRMLSRHGFAVTAISYCNFNICFAPVDELLPSMATRLAIGLERASRGRLRWLGCVMVVQAVRESPL